MLATEESSGVDDEQVTQSADRSAEVEEKCLVSPLRKHRTKHFN